MKYAVAGYLLVVVVVAGLTIGLLSKPGPAGPRPAIDEDLYMGWEGKIVTDSTGQLVVVLLPDTGTSGMPVQNPDGSWTPAWQDVGDAEGIVGVARTSDMYGEPGVHPLPVYSLSDRTVQIGWLGGQGYYPLEGTRVPACPACPTIVERVEDGIKYRMTIRSNGTVAEGIVPTRAEDR